MCRAEVSVWASPAAHTNGAQVLITMTALCSACCTASLGSEKPKQTLKQGTQEGSDSII